MGRHLLALALALVALPACSLFTSFGDLSENEKVVYADAAADGISSEPPSDAGGGPTDASSTVDAGLADADAGPPNLHPNGAFELSCQGWYAYNSTLASDPTAHGGSASCRVCATATLNDVATIDEEGAVLDPAVGGVYVASGWFRVPDGKSPPPSGVKLVFGTRATNGSEVEYAQSSLIALDTTWKKIDVQLTVTKSAARLRVWAGGKAETGTCFLIDDVRVERRQ